MKFRPLHSWNVSPAKAVQIQEALRGKIRLSPPKRPFRTVAAADVAYSRRDDTAYAASLVFSFPDLELLEIQEAAGRVSFPYIPGFLTFREAPILLKTFSPLRRKPNLLLVDGQGIAHVRGIGIASHLGLLLDIPSIGCAKTRFIGIHRDVPAAEGSSAPLLEGERIIGTVLRTRAGVKPVFVSPGHKIDAENSVRMILALCRGYRIPEPLRLAHLAATRLRREKGEALG
jgi:deoxyribonuclease V